MKKIDIVKYSLIGSSVLLIIGAFLPLITVQLDYIQDNVTISVSEISRLNAFLLGAPMLILMLAYTIKQFKFIVFRVFAGLSLVASLYSFLSIIIVSDLFYEGYIMAKVTKNGVFSLIVLILGLVIGLGGFVFSFWVKQKHQNQLRGLKSALRTNVIRAAKKQEYDEKFKHLE